MTILEKLQGIQSILNAPKNQRNLHGNYNYRSCEDILGAVKPLLADAKAVILITDKIVNIGNHYYVEATATIKDNEGEISVSASAREAEEQKGMQAAQLTGSTSSYARKYALNGLLLIDDTKDADHDSQSADKGKSEAKKAAPATEPLDPNVITPAQVTRLMTIAGEHKWTTAQLKKWLAEGYHLDSTKKILKTQYDNIILALEQGPKEA